VSTVEFTGLTNMPAHMSTVRQRQASSRIDLNMMQTSNKKGAPTYETPFPIKLFKKTNIQNY